MLDIYYNQDCSYDRTLTFIPAPTNVEWFSGSVGTLIWIFPGSFQTWQECRKCEAGVLNNTQPSVARASLAGFLKRLTKSLVQDEPGERRIDSKLNKNMMSILQMFLDFVAHKAGPGTNINASQLKSITPQNNTSLNESKWSKENCAGEISQKSIPHMMEEFVAQILCKKSLTSSGLTENVIGDILLTKDMF